MTFHLDKEFHLHFLSTVVARAGREAFQPVEALEVDCWRTPEPVPFAERESGEHRRLAVGDQWGGLWDCAWMRLRGRVPGNLPAGAVPVLLVDVEGEALLCGPDGEPIRGLTHMQKPRFIFPQGKRVHWLDGAPGGEFEYWLDCGANDLFGDPPVEPKERKTIGSLAQAHAGFCLPEMRALYYDLLFLREMLEVLPPQRARRPRILRVMTDAAHKMVEWTEAEAKAARAVLAPEVGRRGPQDPALTLHAIGHGHLDLAWLWPIRETKRKGVRTFASVLATMEQYPEYLFTASQPQLLEWIREDAPGVFERIQGRVREGRWEMQGGMWVEADSNMSGGEALARQFLHGQRYFQEHFGAKTEILWLPDCFGYSAALPQLAQQAGVKYFVSIKPSWNLFTKLPFSTFVWRGLDGSELLGHMPPADCYNTPATPITLRDAEEQFKDSATSDAAILVFGVGDGGGGPGAEHLEALRREACTEGLPAVRHGRAIDFFKRIEPLRDEFERWSGEIYLERHQGTFTSQAWNKRFNRLCECLLHQVEALSLLRLLGGAGDYPAEELRAIWKEVLLYQFHDILPGSSITRVHRESQARYRVLADRLREMAAGQGGGEGPASWFNALSWDRDEWVRVDGGWARLRVPSLAAAAEPPEPAPDGVDGMAAEQDMLSNGLVTVRFEDDGTIASIYDHAEKREIVPEDETLNQLDLYHDWWAAETSDAWDMTPSYRERHAGRARLEESTWEVDGPRAVRRQVLRVGASAIRQEIVLAAGSRRIDFHTRIEWNERGKMLRAAFPVAIHAPHATCEVQFGHVQRPVHRNTVADKARFEVAAQKWVDLSQQGYGVALLNNGKYGHSLHEGRLELDLLRSPSYPDPEADAGEHEFSYALYPHRGGPVEGGVRQAACELNQPLLRLEPGAVPEGMLGKSLVRVSNPKVLVEGLKLAEEGGDLVVRLYEAAGCDCRAQVRFCADIESAHAADILEEPIADLPTAGDALDIPFRPFEVKTLRVSLRRA